MTSLIETPAPVLAMRESAAALADRGLMAEVEEFLAVAKASREAWDRLHLTDTGGWGGLEDEAERLDSEAEAAWRALEIRFIYTSPTSLPADVRGEVMSVGVEYADRAARRRPSGHVVVQSGPCDWSRGR